MDGQARLPECLGLPTCAPPPAEPPGRRRWPCGRGPASDDADAELDTVLVYAYGANMGCAKLLGLGIKPVSMTPARALGMRVHFGVWPGVRTWPEEPAWGALLPGDGCAHGVVHELRRRDIEPLAATEPGYLLNELPDVRSYHGTPLPGVRAFVPAKPLEHQRPSSRRYAGLVLCQARARLSPAYARQLACELADLGFPDLDCDTEQFQPLVAPKKKHSFLGLPPQRRLGAVL